MFKPKVEFYNHYICLLPWPKDLKVYCSNLPPNVYVPAKFERYSKANDREIAEHICFLFPFLVTLTCDLPTWKFNQLMYKLLFIYQPSLKEIRWKMTVKSEDARGWKEEK